MATHTAGTDVVERFGDRLAKLALIRPRAPEPLPIRLHRKRIFLLPTGYGVFLAALLMTMLLGALNYNNNPALLLGFVLAAAALNGLVQAHLILSGLRLRALHAEPVHAGGLLRLRCVFDAADARRRRALELRMDAAHAVFALPPGDRAEVELAVPVPRRGWWSPARMRVSTLQPFGQARAWSWLRPDSRFLVYPALEAGAPPLPEGDGDKPTRRHTPWGEEFHHLRDYRVGDPTRQIAWRPSARVDRLLVREYESSAGRELRLDWLALGALEHEARIRRLARWVVEAERAGARWRLILPRVSFGPARGPEHRHACLRALALMPDA